MPSSLLQNSCLPAMRESDVRSGPRPVVSAGTVVLGVVFWFLGRIVSHHLGSVCFFNVVVVGDWIGAEVGAGGSISFSLSSCCSGHSSAFRCCCPGSHFRSHCLAPVCHDACRPLLAAGSRSSLPALAPARIFVAMSGMPVPHSTSSLWPASHFPSLSSNESFMPSLSVSTHFVCASSILAILSTVWFNFAVFFAYCLIARFIQLLQSSRVLMDYGILLLSDFAFVFHSRCLRAAMNVMYIVFPDSSLARLLASPASAIFISLLIGDILMTPPMGLPPHQSSSSLVWWSSLATLHCVNRLLPRPFANPLNYVVSLLVVLCLVLATGPGNRPAVRVSTTETGQFGSRSVQNPDPLTLSRPNPDPYPSTRGFRQVWLDPSVPISGSEFRVSH